MRKHHNQDVYKLTYRRKPLIRTCLQFQSVCPWPYWWWHADRCGAVATAENLHLTHKLKVERYTGPCMGFCNSKAHSQWHSSYKKPTLPNPSQAILLTGLIGSILIQTTTTSLTSIIKRATNACENVSSQLGMGESNFAFMKFITLDGRIKGHKYREMSTITQRH